MTSKTLKSILVGGLSLASLVIVATSASAGEAAAPAPAPAPAADAAAPAADAAKPKDEAKPAEAAPKSSEEDDEDMADEDTLKAQEAENSAMAKDLSPQLKPIYDLGEGETKGKRIKIDAWVDKKNLSYEIGDTLTVSVAPKQDAYITILNVGSSGRVAVIYPNHYQRDAKVRAGKVVRIPAKKAKWTIEVGGPSGVDLIKVIASKKPLTLKELQGLAAADEKSPLLTLGRSAEETAKDLSPQLKPDADDEVEAKFGVRNILVRVRRG